MYPELEAYSLALQVLKLTLVELNGELARLVCDVSFVPEEVMEILKSVDTISKDLALLLTDPEVVLSPRH